MRVTGDVIAFAPPLIIKKEEIDQLFGTAREVLKGLA
jgi:beta-alanine--pyruvate transaminase